MKKELKIVVVGMGYVGIPVAALFADIDGFNVIGLQRRSKRSGWKIDYINQGKSPIGGDEPGLAELIKKVVDKKALHICDDFSVCRGANAIIITVQTPIDDSHKPIYTALEKACIEIGNNLQPNTLISLESTVAPGTTKHFVKPIIEKRSSLNACEDFNLVYSYERIMVGRLLHSLTLYPRIIGGLSPECTQRGITLYKNLVKSELYPTDCLTAEVAKVAENTYRDVNIAFANEVAMICESLGANAHDVRTLVNSLPFDPSNPSANPFRDMHIPGAGVGGHCLPKDPWLLKYAVNEYGKNELDSKIIVSSREVNDYMPFHMVDLIEEALHEKDIRLQDSNIVILGFAFIENSDDSRNTPALTLYNILKERCRSVSIHDPYIKHHNNLLLSDKLEESVKNKDCIVLVTKHNQYYDISPSWLKEYMKTLCVVDGRNVFDRSHFEKNGFSFKGIGIPR